MGIARYDRTEGTSAEVAFNISDAHQGRGLGSVLLEHLTVAARERGITRFVADVLPQNRKMMTVFTEAGYEVALATDGEDCLRVLGELRPDIVLLDVRMPKI